METVVYVDHYNGTLTTPLSHEAHFFYDDPGAASAIPSPLNLPYWDAGLEFRTDVGDSSTAIHKSTRMIWAQRPCTGTSTATNHPEVCSNYLQPITPGAFEQESDPPHDPQVCQINTNLDGGPDSGTVLFYDHYNHVTDLYQYDYGSAPAIAATCPTSAPAGFSRHINTVYDYDAGYVNLSQNHHLWNLPKLVTINDAKDKQVAQRQLTYDAAPQGLTSYSSPGGYQNPNTTYRGDVTSDTRSWNTTGTNAGHTYAYDILGNVLSDSDANGNVTTFSYTDGTYARVNQATFASGTSMRSARPPKHHHAPRRRKDRLQLPKSH